MLLGLHHIGRIGEDEVKLPEVEFLFGVQDIGIDESRGLGAGGLDLGGEILAPGHVQGAFGVVHAHHMRARDRQGDRPGDVARSGTEVQDAHGLGTPAVRDAALLDPGRQFDGLPHQEFRLGTGHEDILVHLEDMSAELGLAHDILDGFAGLEPDHCLGEGLHLLLVNLVLRLDDMRIVLGSQHFGAQLQHHGLGFRRGVQVLQRGDAVADEFGQEHGPRRFR